MTQRRHHFAVEYCPPSEDGVSRWFRALKDYAVGIVPIYVKDNRELAFWKDVYKRREDQGLKELTREP